jgi:hypothetical protein
MRSLPAALCLTICAVLALSPAPSRVAAATATPAPLVYHTQLRPQFRSRPIWTGDLRINVDAGGNITGTYRSTTVGRDPFFSQQVTVSGKQAGGDIHLELNSLRERFRIDGQFQGDNIIGTAYDQRFNTYDFLGQRAH